MGSCRDVLSLKRSRRQPPHLPPPPGEGLSLHSHAGLEATAWCFCRDTTGTGTIRASAPACDPPAAGRLGWWFVCLLRESAGLRVQHSPSPSRPGGPARAG